MLLGKIASKIFRKRRQCYSDLLVTARAQEAVNLQMEAMGANNSSGQVNAVVYISSEQVNSVVDGSGGTSSGKRDYFNCI